MGTPRGPRYRDTVRGRHRGILRRCRQRSRLSASRQPADCHHATPVRAAVRAAGIGQVDVLADGRAKNTRAGCRTRSQGGHRCAPNLRRSHAVRRHRRHTTRGRTTALAEAAERRAEVVARDRVRHAPIRSRLARCCSAAEQPHHSNCARHPRANAAAACPTAVPGETMRTFAARARPSCAPFAGCAVGASPLSPRGWAPIGKWNEESTHRVNPLEPSDWASRGRVRRAQSVTGRFLFARPLRDLRQPAHARVQLTAEHAK